METAEELKATICRRHSEILMLSNLELQISWRYGVPVLIGRLPHVRDDDSSHGFKTKLTILYELLHPRIYTVF